MKYVLILLAVFVLLFGAIMMVPTQSAYAATSYTFTDSHIVMVNQQVTRYADYQGNPKNKNCPNNDGAYTSTDSSKPCSRVVTIQVPQTDTFSVTFTYNKWDKDLTKCHRPTAGLKYSELGNQ